MNKTQQSKTKSRSFCKGEGSAATSPRKSIIPIKIPARATSTYSVLNTPIKTSKTRPQQGSQKSRVANSPSNGVRPNVTEITSRHSKPAIQEEPAKTQSRADVTEITSRHSKHAIQEEPTKTQSRADATEITSRHSKPAKQEITKMKSRTDETEITLRHSKPAIQEDIAKPQSRADVKEITSRHSKHAMQELAKSQSRANQTEITLRHSKPAMEEELAKSHFRIDETETTTRQSKPAMQDLANAQSRADETDITFDSINTIYLQADKSSHDFDLNLADSKDEYTLLQEEFAHLKQGTTEMKKETTEVEQSLDITFSRLCPNESQILLKVATNRIIDLEKLLEDNVGKIHSLEDRLEESEKSKDQRSYTGSEFLLDANANRIDELEKRLDESISEIQSLKDRLDSDLSSTVSERLLAKCQTHINESNNEYWKLIEKELQKNSEKISKFQEEVESLLKAVHDTQRRDQIVQEEVQNEQKNGTRSTQLRYSKTYKGSENPNLDKQTQTKENKFGDVEKLVENKKIQVNLQDSAIRRQTQILKIQMRRMEEAGTKVTSLAKKCKDLLLREDVGGGENNISVEDEVMGHLDKIMRTMREAL